VAINIFQGARRLVILLGVAWIIVTGSGVYWIVIDKYQKRGVHVYYLLSAPNTPLLRTDERDRYSSENTYSSFNYKTNSGRRMVVNITIKAHSFTDKNGIDTELIPYKVDEDGTVWGARSYSDKVQTYKKRLEKNFVMSAADEDLFIKEHDDKWWLKGFTTLGYFVGSFIIFYVLVCFIGWIVRGSLGIPRGMDKRPDLPTQTSAPEAEPKMDIIKSEKLKQFSVADELSKWAKLKEDGHITEEEFDEARKSLLKQK
jgi:hypothetical protein